MQGVSHSRFPEHFWVIDAENASLIQRFLLTIPAQENLHPRRGASLEIPGVTL
jgi:hypothetical protein